MCRPAGQGIRSTRGKPSELKIDTDTAGLRADDRLFVVRYDELKQGVAFCIGRATELLHTVTESFTNMGDPKTAASFKKDDEVVCVQFITRFPVGASNTFKLTSGKVHEELFVNVKALRAVIVPDRIYSEEQAGPRTRSWRRQQREAEPKLMNVYLSNKTIDGIHKAIAEFEVTGKNLGRWKEAEDMGD